MSVLRPYQIEAVAAVHRDLAQHRSTLLVMATGTGKTQTAIEFIAEYMEGYSRPGGDILWLAHRDELIGQAEGRFLSSGFRDVGREQGKLSAPLSHIVCGSVQTIKGARLGAMDRNRFDLIVIDEAHRAAAKGYQAIVEHFASAKFLGLTATPDRLDGKPLGDIFDTAAYEYPIDQAIRDRWLAPIRSHQVVVEGLELGQVRRTRGDLNRSDLSKLLNEEGHIHAVVDPLLRLATSECWVDNCEDGTCDTGGVHPWGDGIFEVCNVCHGRGVIHRPTVVFAVDVEHARAIVGMLERYRPGCAGIVTGKTKVRQVMYQRHARREFQFLVNCEVLTEGWDAPYVSCIAIARPTMSRALYAQMVGRGTRLHPGKADLLVLDFVGNGGRHALIGPADVLAGRVVEPELRAAMARLKEDDPALADLDCLALAEAWLASEREKAAQQARITAVAKFFTEEIDPFIGKCIARSGGHEPPTTRQLRLLGHALKPTRAKSWAPPDGLSGADAAAILDAVAERKAAGLCSMRMARTLARQGYPDTHKLTAKNATHLIMQCKARGWRPLRRR